jgi:prophage regulatory protein
MTTTLLRLPEVIRTTGLCRASIYKYMTQGEFPRSIVIAKRAVAWKSTDIAQWIDSRTQSQPQK